MESCKLLCLSSFVLLLLMTLCSAHTSHCPPGFIENKNNANSSSASNCSCGTNLDGIIDCDEASGVARLAIGYCMTFHTVTNSTLIGRCPFNNNYTLTKRGTVALYVTLPEEYHRLKPFLCGQYNRHDFLCNDCKHSHRSSMISYSQKCIPCGKTYRNLGRIAYFFLQVIPVTIVYIVVIVFDIRLTNSPWSVFILYSQVIVSMLKYDRHLYSGLLYITSGNKVTPFLVKIVLALYGFWNLDFLPNILPPFCLDIPKNGRHEIAYQYLVALYPLVLILFIYFCVHLYSRDVKCVVILWRAVAHCINYRVCCGLKYMVKKISSQSIAHSFSSFLVLAFPKFLMVSLEVLLPIQIYDLQGKTAVFSPSLFYSPSIQYFGKEQLPFALSAVFILVIFTVMPTLLVVVYPLCVTKCCCRTPLSVRLFVESFNGWFKDGTQEGTRDFRVLAGLHPVLRIVLAISISLNIVFVRPLSPLANHQWLISGVTFLLCSVLFVLARPYKLVYMNQCESALFALLGTISLLVNSYLGLYFASSLGTIPMLIFLCYVAYKLFKKLKRYLSAFKLFRRQNISHSTDKEALLTSAEDFNADRLENPHDYHEVSLKNDPSAKLSVTIATQPASNYGTF